MRVKAKTHYEMIKSACGGTWPKSSRSYETMLDDLGKVRCYPHPTVSTAELRPNGSGRWIVLYNPDLPETAFKAAMVHEASEYLSRIELTRGTLFAGVYAGYPNAAADPLPAMNADHLTPHERMHELANDVMRLWCKDQKVAFDRVLSTKIAPHKGPATNIGYTSTAPDAIPDLIGADPLDDACV